MKISKSAFEFFPRRIRHLFNFELQSEVEGKTLLVPLKSGSGLDSLWSWSWKTEIIKQFCQSGNGAFIDIGANLGQSLIDHFVANTDSQYIGFEPNPVCIYYLTELIRLNSFSQYTVLPIGLADEAKIVSLFYRKDTPHDDSATLIEDLRPSWDLTNRYVPCYSFDYVRTALKLEQISLIKIDVEGAELDVIKGMSETVKSLRPFILCEVLFTDSKANHSFNQSKNEGLVNFLANFNYDVLQLIKSSDDKHIVAAEKIEAFEIATYSEQNKNLCDYLFVPTEKHQQAINSLLAQNSGL